MNIDQTTFNVVSLACKRQQRTLFNNLSFELAQGEMLLVEGGNGSGKSSLLRLLAGLATPTEGNVFWRGESIQQSSENFFAELHYVGHMNGIKLGLTVGENLKLRHCEAKPQEALLAMTKLTQHIHTLAKNLSAGQRRKLALAKLFLIPKKLWILDEPLTALDTEMQEIFLNALDKHLAAGGMAVVSSHQGIEKLAGLPRRILRLAMTVYA